MACFPLMPKFSRSSLEKLIRCAVEVDDVTLAEVSLDMVVEMQATESGRPSFLADS